MNRRPRPEHTFDAGLQQERTSLAWERTAVATMAAGVLFARFAAAESVVPLALFGVAQTVCGAAVLVWAGVHYDELHDTLRDGTGVVHPLAARLLGAATVVFTGIALAVAVHHAVG